MRHGKKINHLSRTSSHRKSMLANMASSLILHKRINTTLAKAKALRKYVEPLITKSKEDSTHSRRTVFSYLQNKEAVTELFRDVSKKIANRPGGYTRILKTGTRLGDNAEMALIELVDYNENLLLEKGDQKGAAAKRRRRGAGKKKEEAVANKASKAKGAAVVEQIEEPEIIEEAVTEEIAEETAAQDISEEVQEQQVEETQEVLEAVVVEETVAQATEQAELVVEEVVEEVAEEVTEPVAEEVDGEEPISEVKEETKAEAEAEEQSETEDKQEDVEGEDKEVK